MDYFQGLRTQIRTYLVFVILAENILLIGGIWYAVTHLGISLGYVALGAYAVSIIMTFIITFAAADYSMQPLQAIWQAVVHLAPHEQRVSAPNINKLVVGRVLVSHLAAQVYQIASVAEQAGPAPEPAPELKANFVAGSLPLPLFVLDSSQTILFANRAACAYIGRPMEDIGGQDIRSVLRMSFTSEHTLDSWLQEVKQSSVTASNTWERVRLDVTDNQPTRLFDLAAYYNKGNSARYETLLVLFDHTKRYSQDDQAVSFMALSVHELRTPLALLRGYIEALEEETRGTLTPEVAGFMAKMSATAQQLSATVSTILNVARVDNEQLVLKLHEEDWGAVVKAAVDMMSLRAQVRGITLKLTVTGELPPVGVDRIGIQEVISNLIDNAIKYSGTSKDVSISAGLNGEGLIETTVRDYGVGIPVAVMPNLFTKFYRDHRNRAQIGGTGLGLYLCKAVVTAHGGNIWVKSKEGKGSSFSFTVLPYSKLAEAGKNGDTKEITRSAHGWIKNHSLYRR